MKTFLQNIGILFLLFVIGSAFTPGQYGIWSNPGDYITTQLNWVIPNLQIDSIGHIAPASINSASIATNTIVLTPQTQEQILDLKASSQETGNVYIYARSLDTSEIGMQIGHIKNGSMYPYVIASATASEANTTQSIEIALNGVSYVVDDY